jgi:hypothetical protein
MCVLHVYYNIIIPPMVHVDKKSKLMRFYILPCPCSFKNYHHLSSHVHCKWYTHVAVSTVRDIIVRTEYHID